MKYFILTVLFMFIAGCSNASVTAPAVCTQIVRDSVGQLITLPNGEKVRSFTVHLDTVCDVQYH